MKINLWFDVTNKILLFYALNLWKKKVCETIERCKKNTEYWNGKYGMPFLGSVVCMNKISWSFHEGGNMGIERESVWKHGKTLLIGSTLFLLTVFLSISFNKLPCWASAIFGHRKSKKCQGTLRYRVLLAMNQNRLAGLHCQQKKKKRVARNLKSCPCKKLRKFK